MAITEDMREHRPAVRGLEDADRRILSSHESVHVATPREVGPRHPRARREQRDIAPCIRSGEGCGVSEAEERLRKGRRRR